MYNFTKKEWGKSEVAPIYKPPNPGPVAVAPHPEVPASARKISKFKAAREAARAAQQ